MIAVYALKLTEISVYIRQAERTAQQERENVLEALGACARERWFLLQLQSKYAGTFEY